MVARDLELVYPSGAKALDSVSLEVAAREHVAILGSSGSGKTSLLGCMSGRLRPTAGTVECAGTTAVIHQDLRLVNQRSALHNVLHGTLGRQPPHRSLFFPAQEKREALALLDRVGLTEQAHQSVGKLSGGEQQRVAIARALMQDPSILLADEPIASLDESLARDTMQLLCDLSHERGLTMICVLHDCALAERFSDRILGIEGGRLVYNARPSEAAPMEPIEHCRACQRINAARPPEPAVRVKVPRWRRRAVVGTAAVFAAVLYVGAVMGLDIHSSQLSGAWSGIARFGRDLMPESWQQLEILPWADLGWSLLQTLQMSLIGTTLGVLISWPLAALAANNVGPPLVRLPMRFALNVLRTVPSLIWALLFIAAVGFGQLPGVLALTAYSIGYLTKFFYEAFEGVDPGPPDALGQIGATGPQRFIHAVWPAARPAVLSSSLFMLEYNVRAASVLGIVGAGGIGFYIMHFLEFRNFPAVMACLLMLLVVVLLLDGLSRLARSRLVRA